MNHTQYEVMRIINEGMGSYLNPPNHPEYNYSVETDIKRKKENRGGMSLSYALQQEYVSPEIKKRIKDLLLAWNNNKLPLSAPETREWIQQVFNHLGKRVGVSFIKKYYPDYK